MQTTTSTAARRYFELGVIVVAAGAIYPLLYLRQNFEVSILESFGITLTQLSQCYAMLGVIFVVTYLPSGWLTDRVSPRILLTFSLATTGLLGLWFSTMPSFSMLQVIFAGWGITTGLTFWSAHIKAVTLLADSKEQGRFFGILDGGRGLFEALLATIAVAWFAYAIESQGDSTRQACLEVIYLYVAVLLILAPVVYLALDDLKPDNGEQATGTPLKNDKSHFLTDLKSILKNQEIWLCATIIICGYQLFWATYSFSGYLQNDFFDRQHVLTILLVLASASLASIAFLPDIAGTFLVLGIVLLIGLLTYAVRGVFWATLDSCNVPNRIKGLAIGVISLIGYSPDIYLPLLNSALLEAYPGRTGYAIYFVGLSVMGLFGALAAWQLGRRIRAR